MAKRIESPHNQLVKRLNGLKLRKNREKEKVFVAEGLRFVSEIPKDFPVEYYVVSNSFAENHDLALWEKTNDVYIVPDTLFASVSETETPQGILAVCQQKKTDFDLLAEQKNGFYLLAEEINDPGNLGTILRTASACGVDAVFLSKGSVDLYHPKVLRATMGAVFHLPIFQNVDIKKTASLLRSHGIPLYGAHLLGRQYPYSLNLRRACAFMIGNEARGLSEEAASLCDSYVKIPMPGKAESLNAAVAAAVLLYEVVRQRLVPRQN